VAFRFWVGLYVARWISSIHLTLLGRRALRTLDDFIADLTSPEETTRQEAAEALANLQDAAQPAVSALVQSLADDSWEVGLAARRALRAVGPAADQVADLMRLLDEPDWAVRRGAVEALGRIGPAARQAVPALVARLADRDPALPARIERALARIAPDGLCRRDLTEALPKLAAALLAREPSRRQAAAEALGRCGRAARAAVPTLLERLIDRHEYVRLSIELALDRIEPTWRERVFTTLPRSA
jgi:HEAT repeat protein